MTEAELKRAVLAIAYANGWSVFHMTASPIHGRQGKGYPDLTLARQRRVVWIELKQEKGILSADQMRWLRELPTCYVIRPSNLESVEAILG